MVLAGLMLGMLVAALDQTVVGTAMPRIIASLGGMSLYSWTFTTYMLASTSLVPVFGKLSDIFGRRRFFLFGIVTFMVGSWLSGASQTMEQLIIFRGIQGVGAACIMPITFAAIADIFPPAQRGRMQGLMSGVWGLASILGPIVGGYIADNLSWRWVFFVNLPVGVLAIAVAYFNLHDRPDPGLKRKVDYLGVALLLAGLLPLLLALSLGGKDYAWESPVILGMFIMAAVMLGLFPFVEARAEEPLIPLSLFRNSIFTVSNLTGFLIGIGMFSSMVFLPLFLQAVRGASATNSGLLLTPMMLAVVASTNLGAQLMTRIGYRKVAMVSMAILVFSYYLLATMDVHTTSQQAMIYMIIMGIGLGPTLPLFVIAVQNSVDYAHLGVATSAVQFFRTMGGTIGVTVLGALMASSLDSQIRQQAPEALSALGGASRGLGEVQVLLDPSTLSRIPPSVMAFLREALANSLHEVFVVNLTLIGAAFIVTWFLKEIPLRKTMDRGRPVAENALQREHQTMAISKDPPVHHDLP